VTRSTTDQHDVADEILATLTKGSDHEHRMHVVSLGPRYDVRAEGGPG
jgi:hypothetical protein